ncbi:MAG: thioesterase family protein [Actinomycetota bacterium]
MAEAFYLPNGDNRFVSTDNTIGPWGPDSQHGGPPSALLGRAIENVDERTDLQVARISFDILRPVPIAPLTVTAEVGRAGRSVQLVRASLHADDTEVMRATAWRIRTETLELEPQPQGDPPPGPEHGEASWMWDGSVNYVTSMEGSFIEGSFLEPGPAVAWLRARFPLIPDEEPSPLQRVLLAADSASGISAELDWAKWLFVNPDLAVYLHRMPAGEWICFDAKTTIDPDGIGLAASTIYDESGPVGRTLQTLFVSPRKP